MVVSVNTFLAMQPFGIVQTAVTYPPGVRRIVSTALRMLITLAF